MGQPLTYEHKRDLTKHLVTVLTKPLAVCYSRDVMLRESVSAFGVDGIGALTDGQFIECLRAVHDYYVMVLSVLAGSWYRAAVRRLSLTDILR